MSLNTMRRIVTNSFPNKRALQSISASQMKMSIKRAVKR